MKAVTVSSYKLCHLCSSYFQSLTPLKSLQLLLLAALFIEYVVYVCVGDKSAAIDFYSKAVTELENGVSCSVNVKGWF